MLTARQYHMQTAYFRERMVPHTLDWENQPDVFKRYANLRAIQLPRVPAVFSLPLSELTARDHRGVVARGILRERVASILGLSCSLTARAHHAGNDFYYRSAASAGALFPNEIYLVQGQASDLTAGIYHYAVDRQCLYALRPGSFGAYVRGAVHGLGGREPAAALLISAIFFRSAWKYRERAYRYVLLDGGHLLQNILLSIKALSLPLESTYDFDDFTANTLVGLDGRREALLACVAIPAAEESETRDAPPIEPLAEDVQAASRVARVEVAYEKIERIHKAGTAVRPMTGTAAMQERMGLSVKAWRSFDRSRPLAGEGTYPEVLFRRRSRRNYVRRTLPYARFERLLDMLWTARGVDAPAGRENQKLLGIGFLSADIEDVAPGIYLLDDAQRRFGMLTAGNFAKRMATVCLNQEWLAQAAVHFLFLADLKQLDETFGARGYRYAMLSAGRFGQMIYLACTALGLGACGIGAFYDSEARQLIGLHADSALLYLVAAGSVKRL